MEFIFSLWLWFSGLIGLDTPPPLVKAPQITFEHSSYIDNLVCPLASLFPWPGKVDTGVDYEKQKTDLERELPRLQKLWNENGPRLLQKASEISNSGFAYDKDVTGLFLCSNIPSWAKPRILAVWQYMPSTPGKMRWNDLEFVDVVFHEHLHMLINRELGWKLDSKLLQKYENESLFTKIHLHLYAIQKQTYLELGLTEEWAQIVKRNKTFTSSYQRAIEIIELEGTKNWISEL